VFAPNQREGTGRRRAIIALALVALGVVALGIAAPWVAGRVLRARLVTALGPDSEVRALRVGWMGIEVDGLRAGRGSEAPGPDTFRVERVAIVVRWRSLLSGRIEVPAVTAVAPYLAAVRARDGTFDVAPRLASGSGRAGALAPPLPGRAVAIAEIVIRDGTLDLLDATVAEPPLRLRLERVEARIRDVVAPSLAGRIGFDVTAAVKGGRRDGQAHATGWVEASTGDSSTTTRLRGLDLVSLQPYLGRGGEARVERGTVDLDLQSEVRRRHLRAPGRVVISDLAFAPTRGARDTFLGIPRDAVLRFLRDRDGRIELSFVLEGDLDHPRFAFDEAFVTRVAAAMAEHLGVSVRGVVEGLRGLGRKGLEAAGDTAKDLGSTVRRLFGPSARP
jgi:hypothetical protein